MQNGLIKSLHYIGLSPDILIRLVSKMCLGLAIGYLLLPFDLIPDFISALGPLDDLVIIPFLVYAVLKMTPNTAIESCRPK